MKEIETDLNELADYLWEKKDEILSNWKDQAEKNRRHFSSLSALSREKFYNSMPELLLHISRGLKNQENELEQISRHHGEQRWKLNFDLRELIEEWGLLHSVITDQISQAPETTLIRRETLNEAQLAVTRTMYKAIKRSVAEFNNMQRLEAKTKITDLETMLRQHDEQSRLQSHNLRQASHDLGGSVAMIQMNLHLLKKKELPDEAAELVEQMSGSAENLVKLFKSLLDLFRLEAGDEKVEVSEFDVAEVMQKLSENMQSLAAERNLSLRTKGEEPFPVRGDWIKVRRIAQNLVMNSLKYTKGGHVEILWDHAPENHWELIIRDTGPGLGSEVAALFNKPGEGSPAKKDEPGEGQDVETTNNEGEGIGLSIVRRLCELLGAVVDVETDKERGTTFRIVFPADYSEEKV